MGCKNNVLEVKLFCCVKMIENFKIYAIGIWMGVIMIERKQKGYISFALQKCAPVIPGYIFLGIAFGLMLQNAGYHVIWAFAISLFVYAGSMQMILVTLLSQGTGLITTVVMTFLINGRHIFYGLSFIDRYKNMGKKYPYMIFSLTDETYSVLCGLKVPKELDEKQVMFYISLFNQCFWILGSVIGSLAGQFITFDVTGIDFSMTALFTVIVIEQWVDKKNRVPIIIGFISAIVFLIVVGPDGFILPALTITVFILLVSKSYIIKIDEDVVITEENLLNIDKGGEKEE